jgi:hypothetical protein
LAIKINGSLWAWGSNYSGQLGIGEWVHGDVGFRDVPIKVGESNDWIKLDAGSYFSLAIKEDGSLWGWGDNSHGQLGLGDNDSPFTVTRVGVDKNWNAVSAGARHVLAIKSDKSQWAWGANSHAELGLGDTTPSLYPTQIPSNQIDDRNIVPSCLTGIWETSVCKGAQHQTLSFDNDGKGSFTNPDCNNICSDLIFPYTYSVTGSSVTLNYTQPEPVSCSGYSTQTPPKPKDDVFEFICSGNQLTTTTSLGTVIHTRKME